MIHAFVVCDICGKKIQTRGDVKTDLERHGWMIRDDAIEHVCPIHVLDLKTRRGRAS